MYAAFGDPVARAKATAAAKKRKEKSIGEAVEEKVETPYSIFDKKDMEQKMVVVLFPLMFIYLYQRRTTYAFLLFLFTRHY